MQAIPLPLALGRRARLALTAGLVAAAGTTGVLATSAQAYTYPTAPIPPSPWKPIGLNSLNVTQGKITAVAPNATLATTDPAVRAVHLGGVHSSARVWFRYLGKSTSDKPLDSGEYRRQIGLKLRHKNQCNLVYVMWHIEPVSQIQVLIKRNPGQTTYNQCRSNGYKPVANIPVAAAGSGPHWLAARTRRTATGDLALSVYADGVQHYGAKPGEILSAADTRDIEGPIGVRSDNGHFVFQLSSQP